MNNSRRIALGLGGLIVLILGLVQLVRGFGTIRGERRAGEPSEMEKAAEASRRAGVKTWSSPDHVASVDLPANFTIPAGDHLLATGAGGAVRVELMINPAVSDMSLDAFAAIMVANMERFAKHAGDTMSEPKLEDTTIQGVPGKRIRFALTLRKDGRLSSAREELGLVVKGGRGFTLGCTTSDEAFADFEPICDTVIHSLKVQAASP